MKGKYFLRVYFLIATICNGRNLQDKRYVYRLVRVRKAIFEANGNDD